MTAIAAPAPTKTTADDTHRARGKPLAQRFRADRVALGALLTATAVLYLWGLDRSGWANSFYSAAAQAGTKSWQAMLFGSLDAGNSITVDKPPVALWVMDLSARIFGLNSWSILVPEALAGVGSVWLLYASVRRYAGPAAGLLAGAVLATTPVAALMFRFNNPDALLVLLLVLAGYATLRALERASTGWLLLAGSAVGFGFLTKMLQTLLVVPAFAVTYLIAAPTPLRRRIGQLLLAGAALVVSAGWWVALVTLWPASSRPYIGGSQHNSVLELTLGYNGFGRLTGNETGGLGNLNADAGLTRLFGTQMAGDIAWVLPAALIGLGAGLWFTRRSPRTDRVRAALVVWGGWLLVTAAVFSFAQGILHPYYTVALAPAVAALVAIGATVLWRHRDHPAAIGTLAGAVGLTAVWSYLLLNRTPHWLPWLRILVLLAGFLAAALLVVAAMSPALTKCAVALGLVAVLAGPTAYAVQTAATPHTGAIPSAGPNGSGGGFAGPPGGFGQFRGAAIQGGHGGGVLDAPTPGAALTALLEKNASAYTWVAATLGANNAAGYQLATGDPVMAIGGFNGTDPSPTLAQFQQDVAAGRIHYFIGGTTGPVGAASTTSTGSEIATWVAAHYSSSTVDGVTVYDLSGR
jgi:4-amino-4-deoxy-L-arabinose transferase-like glycosyltransferase